MRLATVLHRLLPTLHLGGSHGHAARRSGVTHCIPGRGGHYVVVCQTAGGLDRCPASAAAHGQLPHGRRVRLGRGGCAPTGPGAPLRAAASRAARRADVGGGLKLLCGLLAGLLVSLPLSVATAADHRQDFAGGQPVLGQERSHIYVFGNRPYDARLGRFLTPDPVVDLYQPQQLNSYTYARNNPQTYVDPTGEFAFLAAFFAIAAKLLVGAAVGAATSVAAASLSGEVHSWTDVGRAAAVGATAGAILVAAPAVLPTLGFELAPAAVLASDYTAAAVAGGASRAVDRGLAGQPVTAGDVAMGAGLGVASAGLARPIAGGLERVFRPMPAIGNVAADRALSTLRQLSPTEEFLRWESSQASALTAAGGLRPRTYLAPIRDGLTHPSMLVRRYNLPQAQVGRDRLLYGIRAPGTWAIGPRAVAGGTGTEVYLPFGAPSGSVGGVLEASRR